MYITAPPLYKMPIIPTTCKGVLKNNIMIGHPAKDGRRLRLKRLYWYRKPSRRPPWKSKIRLYELAGIASDTKYLEVAIVIYIDSLSFTHKFVIIRWRSTGNFRNNTKRKILIEKFHHQHNRGRIRKFRKFIFRKFIGSFIF